MRPSLRLRSIILLTVLSWGTLATAASPTFGVAVTPLTGGWPALTASASLPIATFDDPVGAVTLSARTDLTAAFDVTALPSVGLTAVATIDRGEAAESYVGTGAALGWRSRNGERSTLLTWTMLAGVRLPLADAWAARFEASSAPILGGFALTVGVDVTPWK